MLTKILFTIAVILIVFVVYKARFRTLPRHTAQITNVSSNTKKPATWIVYAIASVLALAAGVVYFFKWQSDNAVITIRVVTSQEHDPTTYKAFQKDIKGRTFTTVDGRQVTLGDADRIELIDN